MKIFEKKMMFLEKRGCGFRRLTVNTPSPAALRRTTERQTERRSDALEGSEAKNTEVSDAGCAKKKMALRVDFVSTLFEIASI